MNGPFHGLHNDLLLEQAVANADWTDQPLEWTSLLDEVIELEYGEPANEYERAALIGELLDQRAPVFKDQREKAYLSILERTSELRSEGTLVLYAPAILPWRGLFRRLKDHEILAERVQPDAIVTLIDAEWKVLSQFDKEFGAHVEDAAIRMETSLARVLSWMTAEVSAAEHWTEWVAEVGGHDCRHAVVPTRRPDRRDPSRNVPNVEWLGKLADPGPTPFVYASYAMSQAPEEVRSEIRDHVQQLKSYGVVVDPASIELSETDEDGDQDLVFVHTIHRDLQWFVGKVDIVLGIHPYEEDPVLSTGMIDELQHAKALGTEAHLVFPQAESPFTQDRLVPSRRIHDTMDDFRNYVEKRRRPTLEARFPSTPGDPTDERAWDSPGG